MLFDPMKVHVHVPSLVPRPYHVLTRRSDIRLEVPTFTNLRTMKECAWAVIRIQAYPSVISQVHVHVQIRVSSTDKIFLFLGGGGGGGNTSREWVYIAC